MTRLYLRDTLITGTRYELSETQGTGATLGSGNEAGSTFVEKLRFEIQVDDTVTGTSFPCSIDMASVSASTLEWRWRVVKVNSSGTITAGSAYSSVFNTAGIKTATLTLSTTWAAGDRLGVSLELRKTGGGGNRSFTLNVNDADSKVDATITAPPTNLTVQDASLGFAVESPSLTQVHSLTVQDAALGFTVDNVTVAETVDLTVQDVGFGVTVEQPTLTQAHVLAVEDASLGLAIDSPTLTQAHSLQVDDASLGMAVESPSLTQGHVLAVEDASLALSVDNVNLSGEAALEVQDAAFVLAVESPSLTQVHELEVQDASLSFTADNVVLIAGAPTLEADPLSLAFTAENVALTQLHQLTVQDAAFSLQADNVGLIDGSVGGPVAGPTEATVGQSSNAVTVGGSTNTAPTTSPNGAIIHDSHNQAVL